MEVQWEAFLSNEADYLTQVNRNSDDTAQLTLH